MGRRCAGWASIKCLACGPSVSSAGQTSTAQISGSLVLVADAESLKPSKRVCELLRP